MQKWMFASVLFTGVLVGAENESTKSGDTAEPKKIVFLAGKPSHGYGAHEHRAGSLLLAGQLNKHLGGQVAAEVHSGKDWPGNAKGISPAEDLRMG